MPPPLHTISGCGPGTPRPPDTPQEGVRSVRVRYNETSALLELGRIVGNIDALLWADVVDWPEVARTFQKGADVAGVLSHHYRKGDRSVAGNAGVFTGEVEVESHAARARQADDDAEKWLPIEQMKRDDMESAKLFILWSPSTHTYTCQGRYWMQGGRWEDEDGNRMEPTHFHALLPPPAQEGG